MTDPSGMERLVVAFPQQRGRRFWFVSAKDYRNQV